MKQLLLMLLFTTIAMAQTLHVQSISTVPGQRSGIQQVKVVGQIGSIQYTLRCPVDGDQPMKIAWLACNSLHAGRDYPAKLDHSRMWLIRCNVSTPNRPDVLLSIEEEHELGSR